MCLFPRKCNPNLHILSSEISASDLLILKRERERNTDLHVCVNTCLVCGWLVYLGGTGEEVWGIGSKHVDRVSRKEFVFIETFLAKIFHQISQITF